MWPCDNMFRATCMWSEARRWLIWQFSTFPSAASECTHTYRYTHHRRAGDIWSSDTSLIQANSLTLKHALMTYTYMATSVSVWCFALFGTHVETRPVLPLWWKPASWLNTSLALWFKLLWPLVSLVQIQGKNKVHHNKQPEACQSTTLWNYLNCISIFVSLF